jgi:E3 ubiquitin-protein ligase CCNP1IP1
MEIFGNLTCNLRRCNKCLDTGYAWVTSCSHIFCNEDGEKLFQNNLTCPICLKLLDSKTELIRIQLKPNEQYRNMILCGQRPETIFDICSKGLSFWFSQIKQQNDYLKHVIEKEREKRLQSESLESNCHFLIKQMQSKQEELKRENESLKKIIMEKFSTFQKQTDECNKDPLFSSNMNFNNRNLF